MTQEWFSELELDALTELINLGVSRAATSLRDLVEAEVVLTVPFVRVLDWGRALDELRRREPDLLVGVQQDFSGDIKGRALLIFPDNASLELVRIVTGNLSATDILDLEQETLSEIGNIILNGCMATIANTLERSFGMSLPEVLRGDAHEIFASGGSSDVATVVLFLFVDFSIEQRNVRGYIALIVDVPSLQKLRTLLSELIQRTT